MRAVIYIRIARDDHGDALERQRHGLRDHVHRQGWAPAGEYLDVGQWGTALDRPGLAALIDRVARQGDVDAVVVHDATRLARDLPRLLELHRLFTRGGVQLVSVTQPEIHELLDGMAHLATVRSRPRLPAASARRLPVAGHRHQFAEDDRW